MYLIDYKKKLILKEVDKTIWGVEVARVLIKREALTPLLVFDSHTISDYNSLKDYQKTNDLTKIIKVLEDDYSKADYLVKEKFKGKKDKGGHDYYFSHLKRVSYRATTIEGAIVGLLHDLIEDTDYKNEDLLNIFGYTTTRSVLELTRKNGDFKYFQYIKSINDAVALEVKREDLQENLDVNRLEEITVNDLKRCEKYRIALEKINKKYNNILLKGRIVNEDCIDN